MSVRYVIDTGPLVALLNSRDAHHDWAKQALSTLPPPLFTCEAVISEACFLVSKLKGGPEMVMSLVADGIVKPTFRLADEVDAVRALMKRFSSVPMSLADACLVRMTELEPRATVITLDQDFRLYRRNGRKTVPHQSP